MPLSLQLLKLQVKPLQNVKGNMVVFPLHFEGLKSACFSFGIIALGFRSLRHGAASSSFEKGLNAMPVATIKGHEGVSMLQRYTHLGSEDLALWLDAA